jgi:hypothetical protein
METLLQINIPIGMSRLADDSLTARTTPKDFGRWSKMIQSKIERPMFLWFANLSTKGPKTQRSIPFDHFALFISPQRVILLSDVCLSFGLTQLSPGVPGDITSLRGMCPWDVVWGFIQIFSCRPVSKDVVAARLFLLRFQRMQFDPLGFAVMRRNWHPRPSLQKSCP